jgi:hypothetical protein
VEAITLAIITASLGLLTWTSQQIWSGIEERRKYKEDLYRKLLDAIIDISVLADSAPLVVESQRMWMYASDDVLEAVYEYLRYCLSANEQRFGNRSFPDNVRNMIKEKDALIRLAIRRDIRPRTKIDRPWILSRFLSVGAPPDSIKTYRERT